MNARTWMSAQLRSARSACRLLLRLLAVPALLAGSGCVLTESWHQSPKEEMPPTGAVHQVQMFWENRIIITQDVVNGGVPLKALGGRMFLFGVEAGYPVLSDGMVVVEMSDPSLKDPQGKPLLIERWEIDAKTLQRLVRKDMIGWGYSLLLPWNTFKPDMKQMQMQVRYVPSKGLPLFSPPSLVTLREDTQVTVSQRQYVPGQMVPPVSVPTLPTPVARQ